MLRISIRAISRSNHWKELFFFRSNHALHDWRPRNAYMVIRRISFCRSSFRAEPDSIDRLSLASQTSVSSPAIRGVKRWRRSSALHAPPISIEDAIRKISRRNCHQQINRSLLLVHVDTDYGSVICSNIVLFSWIFFFLLFW